MVLLNYKSKEVNNNNNNSRYTLLIVTDRDLFYEF